MDLIQPSFAKGEISPDLYGRVDIREYQLALKKARNTIVHQFGGISNRPGLQFLAPVKNHATPPRLLPFQFKTTDTHIIEFGHEYIRILRNDEHVIDFTSGITSITQANPAVLTGISLVGGFIPSGTSIVINSAPGMTSLEGRRFNIVNTFTGNQVVQLFDPYTGLGVDTTSIGPYTGGGNASVIFQLTTPYQQEELRDVQYTQTADVMTLIHPNYPPKELKRFAVNDWTLTDITFQPTIPFPLDLDTSGGSLGVDSQWQVTAIASNGEESLPAIAVTAHAITAISQANPGTVTSAAHGFSNGDIIHLQDIVGMTQLNNRRFTITNVTANTFDLLNEDTSTYTLYVSNGNAYATYIFNTNSTGVVLIWDAVVGAVRYRVFKQSSGVYGFVASVNGQTYTSTGSETPNLGDTPPQLFEPFLGTDNRPRAVGFHQQRMVMGGSNNKPDTSYFSVIGNFHNFSHAVPIRADDGFSASLTTGQVNEIRHYTSIKDLLINTSGLEWAANGSNGDSRFSVDTYQQQAQTNWGSNNMPPITIGQTVLFTEPSGTRVRSTAFSFADDHYVADDLSIWSTHMFAGNQILEWGMVKNPDPLIYMVRTDGQLLCMSFNEEQKILAWTTWDTDGEFVSVATVKPTSSSLNEEGYFVVHRKINGYSQHFIERTHIRFFADVRDCFFLDSGLSLDAPCVIEDIVLSNPIVITCSGHGFSNGDEVDAFDFIWEPDFDATFNAIQPDQLNTHRYVISNVTTNTFTIPVDGTIFNDYISGGTIRKAVSSVTGLFHLPSTEVVVFADGNVISNLTTSATGGLNFSRKFSRIHIGLRYVSDLGTLKAEIASKQSGSKQGQLVSIPFVTVRVKSSRGFWYGPDADSLIEAKWRDQELMGDPTDLFTGDKEVAMVAPFGKNGEIFIRQFDPVPLTVLAIVPSTVYGDR